MAGHVQADSPSNYLLHGWKGNEDEDVDVDISGGSSEEEIEGLRQHPLASSSAARESASLKKVFAIAEALVTSNAGALECDSLAAKSRTERVKTFRDGEQILNQTVTAKQVNAKKGLEEPGEAGEMSGAKGNSCLQPRKFCDRKRLDARKFRDHFAAKLGLRRANIAEGNKQQGEASSAMKDKSVVDGPLELSKGESPQQAGTKAVKERLNGIDEEGVMLHVNLEVEQEKGIRLPCNGDCDTANKESFQVFTRKRKQASEGAIRSEKTSNEDRNKVQVETSNERSIDSKDAERSTDRPPESPKSNTINGRSKRARKHYRQTDYIPWSDFGRLSAKKSESYKCLDSAPGTDTDSMRTGSKNSYEKRPEGSTSLSEEIRVSSHPSSSQDIELDDGDSKKGSQNSSSMSGVVEKEHGTQVLASKNDSSCTASGKDLDLLPDKGTRSSTVQDKHVQQDSESDAAKTQDGAPESCHLSNGAMDLAEETSIHRIEVLQNKSMTDHDLDIDPNSQPSPKAQEQLTHEAPSASCGLHLRYGSIDTFLCGHDFVIAI
ncbi:hypothetical protein L7F22_023698 [Adiantum nelumboides]|nr:hypothetical protein [Adiantum nelumboides]